MNAQSTAQQSRAQPSAECSARENKVALHSKWNHRLNPKINKSKLIFEFSFSLFQLH